MGDFQFSEGDRPNTSEVTLCSQGKRPNTMGVRMLSQGMHPHTVSKGSSSQGYGLNSHGGGLLSQGEPLNSQGTKLVCGGLRASHYFSESGLPHEIQRRSKIAFGQSRKKATPISGAHYQSSNRVQLTASAAFNRASTSIPGFAVPASMRWM